MALRQRLPWLIGSLAIVGALILAGYRQANPPWQKYQDSGQVRILTPTLTGKPELCLTCHNGIEEISDSHGVDAFGCVICHGGDRLSLDEDIAHGSLIGAEGNRRNPSDLSTVETSCGGADCHSGDAAAGRDHIARVTRSLHTTYAGGVSRVLESLGVTSESGYYGIVAATDDIVRDPLGVAELAALTEGGGMPDLSHFVENCGGCHNGTPEVIPQPYFYRGTGCAACHVLYTTAGLYQGGDPTISRTEPGHAATHQLTVAVPYTTCNHCHNRGNYDVAQMTFSPRNLSPDREMPASERRYADLYPNGSTHYAVCEYKLDCIDCHTVNEVMGDGDIYTSQRDAVRVECRTCHGTLDELPLTVMLEDVNDLAFRRATLNPYYDVFVGNTVILGPNSEPMEHTRVEGDLFSLVGKATGSTYLIPQVYGSLCEQEVDRQAATDCQECHVYVPESSN